MVSAVQLFKIQRDFLHIRTLYVELCRYFCADVAHRKGQDLFGRVGKVKTQGRRPRRPGDSFPSAGAYGMCPYGVMGFYLIIYT